MTAAYTDDDVTAAEDAIRETFHPEHPLNGAGWDQKIAHVLDAVADQIAARALRQAADEMPEISVDFADAEDAREWLLARADVSRNGSAPARETVVQFDMDPRLPVSEGGRR